MISLVKKHRVIIMGFFALFLFSLLILPALNVFAESPDSAALNSPDSAALNSLERTADLAKIKTGLTVQQIVGRIINVLLGFLGVIFLVLVIYGGFLWMTASGNEEKVKKGRDLIIHASIGLAIVLFAFLLTNFVIFKLADVATSTGNANQCAAKGTGWSCGADIPDGTCDRSAGLCSGTDVCCQR